MDTAYPPQADAYKRPRKVEASESPFLGTAIRVKSVTRILAPDTRYPPEAEAYREAKRGPNIGQPANR